MSAFTIGGVEVVAELSVCVDCAMMLANGELGQGDDTADDAHAARMASALGEWLAGAVLSCGDDCEGWFASSPCDGCASRLAGDRHPAAVLMPREVCK